MLDFFLRFQPFSTFLCYSLGFVFCYKSHLPLCITFMTHSCCHGTLRGFQQLQYFVFRESGEVVEMYSYFAGN